MNNSIVEKFTKTFDVPKDYFSGYFSNDKINDIDKAYIASTITEDDLTVIARQLEDSMGFMFHMIGIFSIIMFIIMIYLLAKIIIEKIRKEVIIFKWSFDIELFNSLKVGRKLQNGLFLLISDVRLFDNRLDECNQRLMLIIHDRG